jgi:hypothetical protein
MAAAQRPGAARRAAQQRRRAVQLIVLVAVLAALLAFELPRLMNRSAATTESASSASAVPIPLHNAKKRHEHAGGDPFGGNPLPNQDAKPVTAGGADPFKGGPAPILTQGPIPGQIVIGRPGGNRHATHGWIVILASIPTRNGHTNAVRFAQRARTVGNLSILNSSNRRPLRGGYWVVYTGPYRTLADVSRRARSVHAAGYGTAYIRELITYR